MKKFFVLLVLLGVCNGCTSVKTGEGLYQQISGNESVEKILTENGEVLQRVVKKIRVTISNHNAKPNGLTP